MAPEKKMANWSDLPRHLWEMIFERVDEVIDRLRFIAVCLLFHSIGTDQQSHRLSRPLLLLPPSPSAASSPSELFCLSDSSIYKSEIPELRGKRVCGSSFGWLFVVDFVSQQINLLNPITRAQILLPPLSRFTSPVSLENPRDNIYFVERATISSSPGESSDFIVLTTITWLWTLAFCKPGFDEWVNLPMIHGPCNDARYFNGKFYVLTAAGSVLTWDLSDTNNPILTTVIQPLPEEIPCKQYLVESIRGELFKLHRLAIGDPDDSFSYKTVRFDFFKLDEETGEWVYGCLCNQAVFIGYNSSISVSTLENPEFKEHGVYFTDDCTAQRWIGNPRGCNDVGLYNREDDKVYKFYENHPFWNDPCIWIMPSMR